MGKPFWDGAGGMVRMGWEEAVAGWQWVDEAFHRIVPPPGEQLPTIDFVLERARILVARWAALGGGRGALLGRGGAYSDPQSARAPNATRCQLCFAPTSHPHPHPH